MKTTLLFKKIYGSMMGGAVGDALGSPGEGKLASEIIETYGGKLTTLTKRIASKKGIVDEVAFQAGAYTDDTYLKHLLAMCIAENGRRVDADDLGKTYKENGDYFDPKIKKLYILTCCSANRYFHRVPARESGRDNAVCNDAAMMIAPVGLVNAGNPWQAAVDALNVGSILQDHHSLDGAASMAAAVAEAMSPKATLESIIEASKLCIGDKLKDAIDKGIELANKTIGDADAFTTKFYENLLVDWCGNPRMSADVCECIPASLGLMIVEKGDTKNTLLSTANFGRDCDTICGMAGGVVGALNGVDSIPAEWCDLVNQVQPDPSIEELSVGIVKALQNEIEKSKLIIKSVEELNS